MTMMTHVSGFFSHRLSQSLASPSANAMPITITNQSTVAWTSRRNSSSALGSGKGLVFMSSPLVPGHRAGGQINRQTPDHHRRDHQGENYVLPFGSRKNAVSILIYPLPYPKLRLSLQFVHSSLPPGGASYLFPIATHQLILVLDLDLD